MEIVGGNCKVAFIVYSVNVSLVVPDFFFNLHNFSNIFWHTIVDVRYFQKLSLYAISRKNDSISILGPNKGPAFFLILAFPVTRYHDQLSSFPISEKNYDTFFRKFSEERTDRRCGLFYTPVGFPLITQERWNL